MLYSTFIVSEFYVIQHCQRFEILLYSTFSVSKFYVIQYFQRFRILLYSTLSFQNFVIQYLQRFRILCYTVPSAFQNFMLYSIFSVSEFYAILYFQRFRILLHCDCVSKDTVTSVLLVQLEMQGL